MQRSKRKVYDAIGERPSTGRRPHLWGSGLLFATGLHIAAATPNVVTLEYSMGFNPMLRGLSPAEFAFRDGHVAVPDRPGLGVSINEDFVREHAYMSAQSL